MNLGIVIAVSEYGGKLAKLPSCRKDGEIISSTLRAESKFDDVLTINEDTKSANLKGKLIEFINKHKTNEIKEIFFYYSGHGEFIDNEFYYLSTDFDLNRRKQTSLENSELDNLLRTLRPELTVKVVDACQSGIPYIKDLDSFGRYLKGTQETFKRCYFLFSSQTDQSSYQDDNFSFFTQSFVEAILKHTSSSIRYKDIIDYISDSFAKNSSQKPFFVVQADFTDQFCSITETLREVLAKSLRGTSGLSSPDSSSITAISLKELVKKESDDYCTEDDIKVLLKNLADKINEFKPAHEASELFQVEYDIGRDYSVLGDLTAIGEWLNENEHNYFAKSILEKRIVEVEEPGAVLMYGSMYGSIYGSDQKKRKVTVWDPIGFRTTIDLPISYIMIVGKPRFPNLQTVACVMVPVVSQTHLRFFTAFSRYRNIGWDGKIINEDTKWRTQELKIKDAVNIKTYFDSTFNDFWMFVLDPIKKRFGLLPPEESKKDSESQVPQEPSTPSQK